MTTPNEYHDPEAAERLGYEDRHTFDMSIPYIALECCCDECLRRYAIGQEKEQAKLSEKAGQDG